MHGKCPVQVYHCFLYIVFFTVPFLCLDTQVLATAATVLQMPTVFSTVVYRPVPWDTRLYLAAWVCGRLYLLGVCVEVASYTANETWS